MAGVDLIVAALAAGATAGVTDTASALVRDSYAGLKDLLRGRFGRERPEPEAALEADETEPGVWRSRIGEALVESGAAEDRQVLQAAEGLLALADPERARSFNIKVDTNYGAVGTFTAPVTFNQAPPVPPAPPAAP